MSSGEKQESLLSLIFSCFLSQEFVGGLSLEDLQHVTIDLLSRFPEVYTDAVASLQHAADELDPAPAPELTTNPDRPASPDPAPGPINPTPTPPWCRCGNCRPMAREIENKCCRLRICMITEQHFNDVVLNGNVLATCMAASRDNFPRDIPRTNESYRHYAYKQYTYLQHGYLGAGNRRVVPSCIVLRVRREYPSPTNTYRGFIDGVHD